MDEKSKESSEIVAEVEDDENSATIWTVLLVTFITLGRIGHGLFISITGPTLLFLAANTNSEVSQVSAMFTGRSGGILVGSIIYSAVMHRFPDSKTLVSQALVLSVNGVVMLATPWCTDLWLLVIITTVGGISFGYTDSGLQAVYLKLWGQEKSRPYIQSFHFGFSIGAFLAPIIASPFLQKASEDVENETNCPQKYEMTTTAKPLVTVDYNATTKAPDGTNPVSWPFVIIAVYIILTAAGLLILALVKVEERLETTRVETIENRIEEPIRSVYKFFIPVIFYYICCVSSEAVFQSYIYSIALCSELQFTVSQASLINTLFWAGFGIGRGTGIFHSNFFDPRTIIITDLIGTIVGMIIMSIWGEYVALITWIISFSHGLFIATLYSSGVSWVCRETNMSGSYMVVFAIGNAIGGMGIVPAGGAIFENDQFNTIYLVLGTCVFNAAFFAAMVFIAHKRNLADKIQIQEDAEHNFYVNKAFSSTITRL